MAQRKSSNKKENRLTSMTLKVDETLSKVMSLRLNVPCRKLWLEILNEAQICWDPSIDLCYFIYKEYIKEDLPPHDHCHQNNMCSWNRYWKVYWGSHGFAHQDLLLKENINVIIFISNNLHCMINLLCVWLFGAQKWAQLINKGGAWNGDK